MWVRTLFPESSEHGLCSKKSSPRSEVTEQQPTRQSLPTVVNLSGSQHFYEFITLPTFKNKNFSQNLKFQLLFIKKMFRSHFIYMPPPLPPSRSIVSQQWIIYFKMRCKKEEITRFIKSQWVLEGNLIQCDLAKWHS